MLALMFVPLLTYLAFSYGYQNVHFYNIWLAITIFIEEMATIYSYITSYLYCVLIQRSSHISFM